MASIGGDSGWAERQTQNPNGFSKGAPPWVSIPPQKNGGPPPPADRLLHQPAMTLLQPRHPELLTLHWLRQALGGRLPTVLRGDQAPLLPPGEGQALA